MKRKPIRRLYFQFAGLLDFPKLDALQIYEALRAAGLIEEVASREGAVTHYREALRGLAPPAFEAKVRSALAYYCQRNRYDFQLKEEKL